MAKTVLLLEFEQLIFPQTHILAVDGKATLQEALLGQEKDHYMTPYLVAEYVKHHTGDSLVIFEYSPNGTGDWSRKLRPTDKWARISVDEGKTWTDPFKIVGEEGLSGEYTNYLFCKGTLVTPNELWQDGPPSISKGEYIWMKCRKERNGEAISEWTTPVRLSGVDGYDAPNVKMMYSPDGQSDWSEVLRPTDKYAKFSSDGGTTWSNVFLIVGEDGQNGSYPVFYFTLSGLLDKPKWNDLNDPTLTLGDDWLDAPPFPVPIDYYVWMTFRMYKDGSPAPLTEWSVPVEMSGQRGDKGEDGQGYEYCFHLGASNINPPGVYHKPGEDQSKDDYCPYIDPAFTTKWTDDPMGVDHIRDVEYVIQRKKSKGVWGLFSSVGIWTNYSKDAPKVKMQYSPTGAGDWSDVLRPTDKYARFSNDNGETWSDSFLIVGEDGLNGSYPVFYFALSGLLDPPKWNERNDPRGDLSDAWTDGPPHPVPVDLYIWMTFRMYKNGGYEVSSQWSKPVEMSGLRGDKGEDGLGYEYCYHAQLSSLNAPGVFHKPDEDQTKDDYCPFIDAGYQRRWTDNPTGVNSVMDAEYVIQRKKHNGAWGLFSGVGLWASYGHDGTNAPNVRMLYSPNGTSDWSDVLRPTDRYARFSNDNGVTWSAAFLIVGENGQNGTYPVFYFALSGLLNPPKWNSTNDPTKPLSNEWTDAPPYPVLVDMYIWMTYKMYKDGQPVTESRWSAPMIMSGQKGDKGEDGLSYEYCFRAQSSKMLPPGVYHKPGEDLTKDDYCPYIDPAFTVKWTDDPSGTDITNDAEYVILRKKTNGTWGQFSGVGLWGSYGHDGEDGKGYENIFNNTTALAVPTVPPYSATGAFQEDDYVGPADLGWSDNAMTPTKAKPYVWVSKRIKKNGEWLAFKTPTVWTQFVEDGLPGKPGDPGLDGPSILFFGEYSSTEIYTISNYTRMVVYVQSGSNKTYYQTKTVKEGAPAGNFSGIPVTSSTYWKSFDYTFKSIATEVLFAEYANIAGWVFKNNKLISQSGKVNGVQSSDYKNPSFVPNITLDGVSGEANLSNTTVSGKIYSNDMYVEGSYRRKTQAVEVDRGLGGVVLDGVPTTLENKTLPIGDNDVYVFLRRDCYDLINTFEFVEPIGELADKYDGATILIMIENSGEGDFVYLFKTKDSNGTLRAVNWFQVGYRLPTLSFCIMQFKFIKWRLDYPTENHSGWYVTQFTPIKF